MLSRILQSAWSTTPLRVYSTKADPTVILLSIGNPTPQYDGTRHSVGHFVLDEIQSNFKYLPFSAGAVQTSTQEGEYSNVILAKSTSSLMNIQGRPVGKFWQKTRQKYENANLVVIHDELQIPLGKVQVRRRNTSARGHNGLRSIDKTMGNDYIKIGIGIGKPTGHVTVSDHVLSKFKPSEMEVLKDITVPAVAKILEEMSQGKYIYDRYEGK